MHDEPDAVGEPTEDLAANTRLALVESSKLCRARPGEDTCDWYHGFYPLLRAVGAAAAPDRHARFYARELGRLARMGGFDRVLIPGAADSGMLQCLLSVYRSAGVPARIRVLDRCETPLLVCRSFADCCRVTIETLRCDLLAPDMPSQPDPGFDLACTHSLLAFFPPAQRRTGIEACGRWLRTGGRLVSTARIDPITSETGSRFTPDAARAFAARVRELAASSGAAAGLAPATVFERALRYAECMLSWPYASAQHLVADLEAGGFAVEQLGIVEVPGRLAPGAAGAGTSQSATYAEFVASRI